MWKCLKTNSSWLDDELCSELTWMLWQIMLLYWNNCARRKLVSEHISFITWLFKAKCFSCTCICCCFATSQNISSVIVCRLSCVNDNNNNSKFLNVAENVRLTLRRCITYCKPLHYIVKYYRMYTHVIVSRKSTSAFCSVQSNTEIKRAGLLLLLNLHNSQTFQWAFADYTHYQRVSANIWTYFDLPKYRDIKL